MKDAIRVIKRVLLFKISRGEMLKFTKGHFIAGLVGTWLVGVGRYWDDPGASFLQHLGLGSVIYIFVLALFIWLIVLPLRVRDWKYFTVLTFISLTSLPAILYAIPVEKFMGVEVANAINVWFLAIVAFWRLCLLFYFLSRFTELTVGMITRLTLLPMCLIISTLTVLNLHRVVFNIMGGMRETSAHDTAYTILYLLTGVSMVLSIPLLLGYCYDIYVRRRDDTLK